MKNSARNRGKSLSDKLGGRFGQIFHGITSAHARASDRPSICPACRTAATSITHTMAHLMRFDRRSRPAWSLSAGVRVVDPMRRHFRGGPAVCGFFCVCRAHSDSTRAFESDFFLAVASLRASSANSQLALFAPFPTTTQPPFCPSTQTHSSLSHNDRVQIGDRRWRWRRQVGADHPADPEPLH